MSKRRASGDGMIRRLKRGLWEGRIVIGHKKNGSPIFKYVYSDSQKELNDKLRALIDVYCDADLDEDMNLTLEEWMERWERNYLPLSVRERTAQSYHRSIENHILPYLGEMPLSAITSADIQRLYNRLRETLSGTSVRSVHNILHQSLDAAVSERLIPKNPVDKVDTPKRENAPKQILNDEQLRTLMEEIKKDKIWHDFFYTEMTTGLRRGEICALKWSDFDTKTGKLSVLRTVRKERRGYVFSDTKTHAGKRTILLPKSTADLLRERKKNAIGDWIFPNPVMPENPVSPNAAYNRLKEILREAGLPSIRFHDCRHTFSSHAIASGVDAKTLAGILGHTNASFTLDTYTHVTEDMKKTAAGIVGGFMEEILGKELKPWEGAEQATA